MKIKYYRQEVESKKGDYVLFNGACYQFCAGDKRKLWFEGYHNVTSFLLSQKMLKQIPLGTMKKIVKGNIEDRTQMIYWFFE
jgi:hypothetical protein